MNDSVIAQDVAVEGETKESSNSKNVSLDVEESSTYMVCFFLIVLFYGFLQVSSILYYIYKVGTIGHSSISFSSLHSSLTARLP